MKREDVIDIFNFRFATKEFNGEIIPREDMNMIMETARLSPSSFGLEPWKFIVVENKEFIKEIAEVAWGFQRQAPTTSHLVLALSRVGKDVKYDSEYVRELWINTKGIKGELFERKKGILKNFQFENLKADKSYDELLDWSKRQAYIALGNMMTSAAMIGIDSCAIEGFNKEKLEEILIKKGLLNKEKFDLTYLVAFGYRKENPSREKIRLSQEKVMEWIK